MDKEQDHSMVVKISLPLLMKEESSFGRVMYTLHRVSSGSIDNSQIEQ